MITWTRLAVIALRARWGRRENLLRLAAFLVVAVIAGAAVLLADLLTLSQAGYAGVGLTALFASGGLIIPVPALATVCATSAFLFPLFIGLIAGGAETAGELTGYFLGYSGRGMVSRGSLYRRLEGWMQRRGWLLLFVVALVPNPVFDVVGVTAGALRYPLASFLGVVLVGKVIKFVSFAYACSLGISWFTEVFL